MIVTRKELADIFGVTDRTVSTWITRGLKSCGKRDKTLLYNTVDAIQFRENEIMMNSVGADFETERTRKIKLEADKVELELRKMRGELIETELVVNEWSSSIIRCKTKLIAIAEKTASMLLSFKNQNEAKDFLLSEIYIALEELSQDDAVITDQVESVGEMETTSETHS